MPFPALTPPRPRPPLPQRARRHIRDAFASRQARGGDRRAAPRRAEKPTAPSVSRRFDAARDREDSRLTDDDVFVAVASAAGAGGAPARPGLVNVFAELIRETRSACGDGKAAALVVSLFLGMLASRKKSRRVVPFAAIANFALARGHGGDAERRRRAPLGARRCGGARRRASARLRNQQGGVARRHERAERAGFESRRRRLFDRSDRADAPEDAELLRVAALGAAVGARAPASPERISSRGACGSPCAPCVRRARSTYRETATRSRRRGVDLCLFGRGVRSARAVKKPRVFL